MWRQADLIFSRDFSNLSCSVITAHPWVYGCGHSTESGMYLSPVNAVNYLTQKIAGAGEDLNIVVLMVAGQSHENFMAALDNLTAVFPAPVFTQVSRLARSAAELAQVKMQKPARGNGGMPTAGPLSVPTARTMAAAGIARQAAESVTGGIDMATLKASLAKFTSDRESLLAALESTAGEIVAKRARVWVFDGKGSAETLSRQMKIEVPDGSSVYSAAILLAGDELDGLRSMLHDINNTGA